MTDQIKRAAWSAVALIVLLAVWLLESARSDVVVTVEASPAGDLHIYRAAEPEDGPLVVVAHGFGGSVQLMQTISRDLARAGFTAVAFDFYGHGRSSARMSREITTLEGTTAQLIAQTQAIVGAAREATGLEGPAGLVGHSMATDILIRAGQDLPQIGAVVAISMYSEAVTARYPERLLVISGAWETRLRDVGLEAVHQIAPEAGEFETVGTGTVQRRTVYAPQTEHVGVLFSEVTLQEIRGWLGGALGHEPAGAPHTQGWVKLALYAGLVVLIFPLARLLPVRIRNLPPLPVRGFAAALGGASLLGIIGVYAIPGTMMGTAALGHFMGFCLGWGLGALTVLWRFGRELRRPEWRGAALLVVWGLVFAAALDRYGAAFVPAGPRFGLMLALLIGTLPFMLADRLLVHGAPLWQRITARTAPIVVLSSVMVAAPTQVGLMFTVLPVMVLFYVVYGTMGRAVARRTGPEAAGIGLAVILAWAIAGSTPLFVGG